MKFKNQDQGKKLNKKVFMLLLLLLLFCATGYGIYAAIDSGIFSQSTQISSTVESKQLDDNGKAIEGAIESKTPEEILEDLKKAQVNVTDKLSSHIFFSSGKTGTEGSWTVENLEANNVIMQCEVYLDYRLIAKSVPIKPNQHIENITLSEDINPGQYDVIAYVNYFKLDTNEYLSKAGFKIKLTVQ